MRKQMVACCAVLCFLGLYAVGFPYSSACQTNDSLANTFGAKLEILLDGSKMRKVLVQSADVINTLERFYNKSPSFKLSELQAIQITTADGRKVELRAIATIDVKFSKLENK